MKVLHTADWHIGKKWGSVDRSDDLLKYAVPDLISIALAERVNLLLIAGDVFERQTPESLESAAHTLKTPFNELLNAGIHIALLLGNHDSSPLFKVLRGAVDLVGNHRNNRGQFHILNSPWIRPILGLQILHLPYIRAEKIENEVGSQVLESLNSTPDANRQTGVKLDNLAQELRRRLDHTQPALMTFHGIVQGASFGADEQSFEFTYHQDYMLSPDSLLFNDQVPQYNALGHIHRCQRLNSPIPTWYSGSIDRLDRGEKDYKPSVIVVDFPEKGRYAEAERHELPRPTPFLDETIQNEVDLKMLTDRLGAEKCQRALGRITLNCDDPTIAYSLEQKIFDEFKRLREVRNSILRPRSASKQPDDQSIPININDLIHPSTTIRKYISEQIPVNRHEGLLKALSIVENEVDK